MTLLGPGGGGHGGTVSITLMIHVFFPPGSGSLAAMAVFEDRYKPDMEVILVCPLAG